MLKVLLSYIQLFDLKNNSRPLKLYTEKLDNNLFKRTDFKTAVYRFQLSNLLKFIKQVCFELRLKSTFKKIQNGGLIQVFSNKLDLTFNTSLTVIRGNTLMN